jgi:hypothetical protein
MYLYSLKMFLGQDIPLLDLAPRDAGSADQCEMSDEAAATIQQHSESCFIYNFIYKYSEVYFLIKI